LHKIRARLHGIEGRYSKLYSNQIFQLIPESIRSESRKKFKACAETNARASLLCRCLGLGLNFVLLSNSRSYAFPPLSPSCRDSLTDRLTDGRIDSPYIKKETHPHVRNLCLELEFSIAIFPDTCSLTREHASIRLTIFQRSRIRINLVVP
jgi:hypothetical protein